MDFLATATDDTESLRGSLWGMIYQTFGIYKDNQLCEWMANIGLAYTAIVGSYTAFQPAPYGRYGSTKFGPTMDPTWAWIIQESPAFIVPAVLVISSPHEQLSNFPNLIALSLFMVHYFNRSFIFPFGISENAKRTPITTTFSAVLFCSYNGFLQGHHLANSYAIEDSPLRLFAGFSLFALGMGINITHDKILMALKNDARKDEDGETEYSIPKGYLFEYISGANYFGEILEWWGFALFTGAFPQVAFAIFTSTFLGIRALHHHKWYKERFGDSYPSQRKALIPFLL